MAHQAETLLIILTFFLVWVGIWGAIAFPLFKKFEWRPFQKTSPDQKIFLLLPLYGLAPCVIWGANRLLAQSWRDIGIQFDLASLRSLFLGLGVAIAGLFLMLWFKRLIRLISFNQGGSSSTSAQITPRTVLVATGLLLLSLWIGGVEELVFRGWMQTQLETAFAPWIAATLGSFVFAAAHLVWDDRLGLWQQPGLFLLGWVLVVARWANDGNLALAWGLHAGWVWSLAVISEYLHPQPVDQKPIWLTGRAEQPLTDVWDLLLLGGTAGLVWQLSRSLA
ncbi:type II CAAX endopeptidase family protein [Oscillatoria sp. CS-180]|uniref:type II CAAX endopeptidase family protein n=1 Tax=Oscillatoria sp. CS-180 TaxID=3021720 RepID=UPI00232CBA64|nr:type II CAAX endopeptidase family protein [Oscillatoria sp. CS-180]MDB9529135.1 type II CAAX endopeptidase family protein [Oscillatoria sp. CS-180]